MNGRKYPASFRRAVVESYVTAVPRKSFQQIAAIWKIDPELVRFWASLHTDAAERAAMRALLGTPLTALISRKAKAAGHDPAAWARHALMSQLRRDDGLRRYSRRLRGHASLGPVADVVTGTTPRPPKRWQEIA
jgi:transposase-like protein